MRRVKSLLPGLIVVFVLSSTAVADECLDCHDLAAISPGGTVVHPPFAQKDCGSCHADHGDQERLALTEEGNALCAQCHAFTDSAFVVAHRKIAPTGKAACTGCHDPHRSPNKRLLRAGLHGPVKTGNCEKCHRADGKLRIPVNLHLCFICHERAAFARPVVHDPVRKSHCLDCHDPHGSGVRLLKGDYTLEREAKPGGKDYGLCLGCHERTLLLGGPGEGTTGFADGERNLHALHVLLQGRLTEKPAEGRTVQEKGLTCRSCHEAHSANTAALTRTELDCGASLCMKMEFRRTEDGGECMASCHSERALYRRPDRR